MWSPKEIRKILVLLTGIGTEVAGIILLVNQVKAEGKINISSKIISGGIESGSAGLLLCFIGFVLLIFSSYGGSDAIYKKEISALEKTIENNKNWLSLSTDAKKYLFLMTISLTFCLFLFLGGSQMQVSSIPGAGILTFFGGCLGFLSILLCLGFVYSFFSEE